MEIHDKAQSVQRLGRETKMDNAQPCHTLPLRPPSRPMQKASGANPEAFCIGRPGMLAVSRKTPPIQLDRCRRQERRYWAASLSLASASAAARLSALWQGRQPLKEG